MNCYLPLQQVYRLENIEELTVIHSLSDWSPGSAWYWEPVISVLPRLRRLSIDGAMARGAEFYAPRYPFFSRDRKWSFKNRSNLLEELNLNRCTPAWAALILRHFTNSADSLGDQQQQNMRLKKLQITCTDIEPDDKFQELCEAIRAWLESWNSATYGRAGDGYLYLSIQPNGIIVHNRRENMARAKPNRKAETTFEEDPEIQLTLYSSTIRTWDPTWDVLCLITSNPNESEFDDAARPFTAFCEELELCIGLVDIEDVMFRAVFKCFWKTLGKAKRLKRLRCVGSATARGLLIPESRELPALESLCFDHVDFSDLDQGTYWTMVKPPSRVEFINCRNVCREWVSELERVGTDVLLGRSTNLVEGSEARCKKVEKKPWTSEQVKMLMNNWANEA